MSTLAKNRCEFGGNDQGITTDMEHHNNAINIATAMSGDIDAILNMLNWGVWNEVVKVKFLVKKVGIIPIKNVKSGKCEFDPKLNINMSIDTYEEEIEF